jgi:hypothetical protein
MADRSAPNGYGLAPHPPSTVRPGVSAKRVLIVDDNEDTTEMMRKEMS